MEAATRIIQIVLIIMGEGHANAGKIPRGKTTAFSEKATDTVFPQWRLTLFGGGVDGAGQGGMRLGGLGCHHDLGSVFGRLQRDLLADAAARASDEDHTTGQLPVHGSHRFRDLILHFLHMVYNKTSKYTAGNLRRNVIILCALCPTKLR